jgi:beta-ureidopropionase / N-carbamoyl-L-amino-acid hydrolase
VISNLQVNGERLWASLMEMAEIGATAKGGNNRLALTDLDKDARLLFANWCDAAGLPMTVDAMGNMFALREGANNALPPVVIGSHLDTQPSGGRFDGVLGVLAALEAVRTLNEQNIVTQHPIEIVNWTNEEGSRFVPAMTSSGVFAGLYGLDFAHAQQDRDGLALGEELERIGFRGSAPVGGRKIHAYFELHIEQGPILENEGKTIGVVTHSQGQRWYELNLTGFESHAGPTPMEGRRDALVTAAKIIQFVQRLGLSYAPAGRATSGMITAYPNSRNVIPGRVFMTCECRNPELEILNRMADELRDGVAAIARETGVELDIAEVFSVDPVMFDPNCVDAVERAASQCGFTHRRIIAGAGHDACNINAIAPTAMIFTPCIDGISHNEAEDIKPEWATAGAQVLLHVALDTAKVAARLNS